VKTAVEGLKRYGKKNCDVIFEGTSGRHIQEVQHSLKKCDNLLKQQYVQLKFTNKYTQHLFNPRESDWGFTSFMPLS